HDVAISCLKVFRAFPVIALVIPLIAAVIDPRPREPVTIHFHAKSHNLRMTKRPRSISPLVDISVPFPSDDVVEIKLIGAAILFVGPVPRRPENERQGTVSPNHVQICRWETLLTPITR